MKKFLAVLLAAMMVVSLAACGGKGGGTVSDSSEKTEDKGSATEFSGENVDISYKGYSLITDGDGKDALVVWMDFTNKSGSTDDFFMLVDYKAFQNGVQIEKDYAAYKNDSYDSFLSSEDTQVQDGNSLEVSIPFVLDSTSDAVEIEFEDFYADDENEEMGTLTIDISSEAGRISTDFWAGDGSSDDAEEEEEENTETGNANISTDDPSNMVFSDFTASYTGYELVKDSDDNDAIAVHFNWTNNSDSSDSFFMAYLNADLFQDGIEQDTTYVYPDPDSYDSLDDTAHTDIQPGASLDVILTWKLSNTTSPVTIEIEDWEDNTASFEIDITQ